MSRVAPPPALPLRSSMLLRLAEERAGGVLQRETGALYLIDGQVVHAHSDTAPGLGDLLVGCGKVPSALWADALDRGNRDSGRAAEHLVKDGQLSEGTLELCRRTALFDAAYFALAPGGGPARFRHGVVADDGLALSVPAGRVLREAMRRQGLLDAVWPGPVVDEQPVNRRTACPDRRVPARQRALLDLVDGARTPAQLARELGRPAFHVLLDIRRLAVAGMVEPPGPRARQPTAPSTEGSASDARARAPDVYGFTTPDIALLQRVRDALEARL
ncbi:hypothetical protein [Streptomyces indicus]|uniref:Uncharacterized protein n=1 Tax=Streptomyces indicus TaxID=417292 RepID=A0A1G9A0Q0_9ACTN|nr:hypothetical protein [Streptomyces indicus]SDK20938.1 hypothetical protein SAMN05421806_105301 [Streptomyces indicus]